MKVEIKNWKKVIQRFDKNVKYDYVFLLKDVLKNIDFGFFSSIR